MSHIYDATLVESERVSPSKFLRLAQENPEAIKSVRFVMPRRGKKTRNRFGSFVVEYAKPEYQVVGAK